MSSDPAMFHVAAETYDRFVGRYGAALARALCDAAEVEAGQHALDVGCGPGALTAELVSRLGAENVASVDPSEPFVAACRARNPGVHVEMAAGESLPFPDHGFDRALAQLVVNFMEDPAAGVTEMARVTRPGGRVAAAVWDYGAGMTMIRAFWDVAGALEPGAPDELNVFRHCREGELGGLFELVGLGDVAVGALDVSADYDSFADLWAPFEKGVGPAGAFTLRCDDEKRSALREQFQRRLGVGDEPFTLTARAWYAVGTA